MKCDYIRYSPSEKSTLNTSYSQIYINIPRETSVNSLLNSYLGLKFDVLHAASGNIYRDGNVIKLINLGPVALFSIYQLTTISGKNLEDISHSHVVSLMYKIITSARGSDDLSIGFDQNRGRRQRELTNNKNTEGKYHLRIMIKVIFGFAEYQEKATYGLGYKLTLTKNIDPAVVNKDYAINNAKIKFIAIEWYVPYCTLSFPQQTILSKQNQSKTPTELQYVERSVFMKEVKSQNFLGF